MSSVVLRRLRDVLVHWAYVTLVLVPLMFVASLFGLALRRAVRERRTAAWMADSPPRSRLKELSRWPNRLQDRLAARRAVAPDSWTLLIGSGSEPDDAAVAGQEQRRAA